MPGPVRAGVGAAGGSQGEGRQGTRCGLQKSGVHSLNTHPAGGMAFLRDGGEGLHPFGRRMTDREGERSTLPCPCCACDQGNHVLPRTDFLGALHIPCLGCDAPFQL